MAQNWSRSAIRAPARAAPARPDAARASAVTSRRVPGRGRASTADARPGPDRRPGAIDAWSSHAPVRRAGVRAAPSRRRPRRPPSRTTKPAASGSDRVVGEVGRCGPRPVQAVDQRGRLRARRLGSMLDAGVRVRRASPRVDAQVEQRPPRPHARRGCTGRAPRVAPTRTSSARSGPSKTTAEQGADPTPRAWRSGSTKRSVRNRTAGRPTATEPPKPDDVAVGASATVRSCRVRRGARGTASRAPAGPANPSARRWRRGSPAMAGTSPGSRRPDGHRPCAGHDLEQPVVRERVGRDAVAADHGRGGDQRVDDRLLGRLDDRVEQPVDDDVADGPDVVRAATRTGRSSSRCRAAGGCRSRRR